MNKIFNMFGVTGFKSKCVAFCYTAFSLIVAFTLIFFAVGTLVKEIQVDGGVLVEIIKICATFFGVAIGAVFGASYVEGKFEKPQQPQ